MSFLRLDHVSKQYGDVRVVHDFNLEVQKGEFVSLLGPSGCGKTTTLQMIAGFVEVTEGSIELEGRDITRAKANARGLGIVFQTYALFPHMTVRQNVEFGLEMRKCPPAERHERALQVLAMVHLDKLVDRYPRELSGGQRQRVALARALVIRPPVLLLDEPLSNLDAKLREEMQFELSEIQRKLGTTTIMVTHDQAEAMSISDRVVVTVLERDLCGSRSSGVNFGGVRRQGRAMMQLPLAQHSHRLWGRLTELIGTEAEYERSGHFKIARSTADMESLARYAELGNAHGLGLQLIEGRTALRAHFPMGGADVVGGSLCPEDGQANPRLLSPAFARAAGAAGADVREHAPVQAVEHDGTRFVIDIRQHGRALRLKAAALLNCAGAWAAPFAAQWGEPVPLQTAPPTMGVTEPLPFFLRWSLGVEGGGLYCRQVRRGNVVFGGGRGYLLDGQRARSSHVSILAQLPQLAALLPRLRTAHVIRTWSGTEGYLPDNQPVLGASTCRAGLFHAFGFAGAGFQLGPGVGDVMAELIAEGRTSTPIDSLSINRFRKQALDPSGDRHVSALR